MGRSCTGYRASTHMLDVRGRCHPVTSPMTAPRCPQGPLSKVSLGSKRKPQSIACQLFFLFKIPNKQILLGLMFCWKSEQGLVLVSSPPLFPLPTMGTEKHSVLWFKKRGCLLCTMVGRWLQWLQGEESLKTQDCPKTRLSRSEIELRMHS